MDTGGLSRVRGTASVMSTVRMMPDRGTRSSGSPGSWPPSAAEVRCLFCTLRPHLKTSNTFPEFGSLLVVENWTFLTNHARVLLCISHDPGVRLRDIAVSLDITERRAYGIVTDLARAGYVIKQKDGRRNRYQIQAHLPLPEPTRHERTVGEVLALLAGTDGSAETDADRPDLMPPPARQNATGVTAPDDQSSRPETAR